MEEDDHSAAATAAVQRRKRKKTKRGTKEKGKGTAVKKVKTNFTHSPGVKFVFTLPPNAVEKDREFR
jgi:hypothetical protein